MDEAQIQENLKKNVPKPYETTPTPPVPVDTTAGQATIGPDFPLDELTQYKLHDFFGQAYKPSDEESKQRIQYIYERVAGMLETPEYGFIVAKIRDLEQIIGTSHDERRIYKLYQWLKLENMRKNIDVEMGALTNG